jgi:hypothetical protein
LWQTARWEDSRRGWDLLERTRLGPRRGDSRSLDDLRVNCTGRVAVAFVVICTDGSIGGGGSRSRIGDGCIAICTDSVGDACVAVFTGSDGGTTFSTVALVVAETVPHVRRVQNNPLSHNFLNYMVGQG